MFERIGERQSYRFDQYVQILSRIVSRNGQDIAELLENVEGDQRRDSLTVWRDLPETQTVTPIVAWQQ